MVQVGVANLSRELEQLFPGKWLSAKESARVLKSGVESLDAVLSPVLIRRHMSEWVGSASSGKTTVLRTICANWCAIGLNIIYIDTFDRLLASDWALVGTENKGRFWVLRSGDCADLDGQTRYGQHHKYDYVKNALWACEQLIRSHAFDVVILDLADRGVITSNINARLKRSLERSNASLVVLRDDDSTSSAFSGSVGRVDFNFIEPIKVEQGVSGPVAIVPTIRSNVFKAGLSRSLEVSVAPYVPNRLFTHSPVPDRRTSKKR